MYAVCKAWGLSTCGDALNWNLPKLVMDTKNELFRVDDGISKVTFLSSELIQRGSLWMGKFGMEDSQIMFVKFAN